MEGRVNYMQVWEVVSISRMPYSPSGMLTCGGYCFRDVMVAEQ